MSTFLLYPGYCCFFFLLVLLQGSFSVTISMPFPPSQGCKIMTLIFLVRAFKFCDSHKFLVHDWNWSEFAEGGGGLGDDSIPPWTTSLSHRRLISLFLLAPAPRSCCFLGALFPELNAFSVGAFRKPLQSCSRP